MSVANTIHVPLHDIAHSREGDKGNWATISLIAYSPQAFDVLTRQATEQRVLSHFAHRGARKVYRYELPKIRAINFVIVDGLEGGVNGSLNLDGHGKTLSFHLLAMKIEIETALYEIVRRRRPADTSTIGR